MTSFLKKAFAAASLYATGATWVLAAGACCVAGATCCIGGMPCCP